MLSWEYPPHIVGGMGKHVADLAPVLAAEGIALSVVTPLLRDGVGDDRPAFGPHVVRVTPPRMEDYGFVAFVEQTNIALEHAAHQLHDRIGFDLIHTHDWLTAPAAINLKQQWRIPLLATIHATERGRWRGALCDDQSQQIDRLEWALTYEAWRVIVCSAFMARQVADQFGTPFDKIDVAPNGVHVPPDPFASADERQTFRRRFAADDEALVFSVGRIVYEKGLHLLLQAWPQIQAQVRARLVIAGVGPYLEALKAQASALGLNDQALFAGYISDADRDRLYRVADVAAFPSLYEPFGIVALEAFAAGCPVVAASVGGLAEVVRMHETGITVYPDNVDSLAWGVLHTLHNREWSCSRAKAALNEVCDRYNWHRIARETIAVYERVAWERQRSSWGKELTVGTAIYANH